MYKHSASPRVYKSDINLRGLYILHVTVDFTRLVEQLVTQQNRHVRSLSPDMRVMKILCI